LWAAGATLAKQRGLLVVPEWANALLFFDQHSPRLISMRFQAKVGQHLTMLSAYSPIDYKDGGC